MVRKGPSNATDLNVLQGKAYEKPCWPQYIRDQYVLKGPHYNIKMNLNPLSILISTHCPQVAQRCLDLTTYTGREITMTSLGNIALSLRDRVMSLKSYYNVYFSLFSSFFGLKSFLRCVLLLTRLFSSSSDVGVKNLANSWHEKALCVYEALLECPVICLSLSHCSYEKHWHSLPAPAS